MIKAKSYDHLIGRLPGFSRRQLEQHIKLYEGYVVKINEIREDLSRIPFDERKAAASFSYGRYSELKRRECVPYNAVYLHEMYFDNLGGTVHKPGSDLRAAIEACFGSLSNWEQDLAACAETATGGWVLLSWNLRQDRLNHDLVWEHSHGLLMNHDPILALDTWEHAFMIDFGTDKKAYLTTFLGCLDWGVVAERFSAVSSKAHAL